MKKIALALCFLTVACLPVFAQKATSDSAEPESHGLVLRGRITELEVEKQKDAVLFFVKLDVEFTNEGTEPIILFRSTIGGSDDRLWLGGWSLYATENAKQDERPVFGDGYWESIAGSGFYKDMAQRLDTKDPPITDTRILQPREKWNFSDDFRIYFRAGKNSFSDRKSWEEMQDFPSKLWLKFTYELSPWNVEYFKPDLLRTLRKRWAGVGKVLVEEKKDGRFSHFVFTSEPLPIDFSQATIREPSVSSSNI